MHNVYSIFVILRMRIQYSRVGFYQEVLTKKQGGQACYCPLVSPKYMAYISLKRHHDRIHVIDLPAAQELIVFLTRHMAQYVLSYSPLSVPYV